LKLHDYNQMMGYMKRRSFANGSPEPTTTFNDKIETLKEASPGLMPRSRVAILKGYMDEALKDGEITQEQHTQMLMPYFGEVGEKVTEQIAVSDRDNFAIGGGVIEGEDLGSREGFNAPGRLEDNVEFQKKVSDLLDKGFSSEEIATKLKKGITTINRTRRTIGKPGTIGTGAKVSFEDLNENKQFEKFFKEYLDKESKVSIAGRAKGSTLWPIMEEALKDLPKNATLEQKFNAIKNFSKKESEYGYKASSFSKYDRPIGDKLFSALSKSFKDAKKGFGTIGIKELSENIPAYKFKTLQKILGDAKKDPNSIKGDDVASNKIRSGIINAKEFVKKLTDSGVVIAQGDIDERTQKGKGSGKAYLFEELTDEVKENLKNIKPLINANPDYTNQTLRRLIATFSRAQDDYTKYNLGSMGETLRKTGVALNEAILNEFTNGKSISYKTIEDLNSAMSKENIANLKQFIDDTPVLKNTLSINFDVTGEGGTYFKPRDIKNLSGGELLKDILVDQDHIRPMSGIEVLQKPTKTFIGKFGEGAALSETPFNKTLTTSYFNKSLRNKIQNFLNANPNNKEAIKQIDNTMKGLGLTINHKGNYYGGKITPKISEQIKKMGYNILNIGESVVDNIKKADIAIKNLKDKKFSDNQIANAIKNSKFALPFVVGTGVAGALGYGVKKELDQGRNPLSMSAEADDMFMPVDPGIIVPQENKEEFDPERAEPGLGVTAAAAPLATQKGRNLYGKFAKQIAKGFGNTVRAIGSPLTGLTLAGSEFADINPIRLATEDEEGMFKYDEKFGSLKEDPSFGQAGAELLLPERIQKIAGKLPKGIMSNFFGLQGLSKFGKLGALAARAPSVMTPVGLTMLGAEGIKKLYDEEQKKNRMIEAMDPEERLQFLQEEKDTEELMSRASAAYGGRMGFADGPEDPKKRKFMKIMGGLASIPLLGRFIDIGTQAPKVAELVRRGTDGVPDFLMDLIAKVKAGAEAKGLKYFTGNKPEEFKDVYQLDNYIVTEKGNKTIIREVDQDGNMLYKENQMEIDYDPETGGYTYNEASARPDAEGKLKDVEEYIEEDDLENMRKYTYDE